MGYPVLGQDLSGHNLVVDLPPALFRACSATPLYYSRENKRLVLGFIQRVDHGLLQSIERITGCRAEPCFITPSEQTRQLELVSGPPRYEEVMVDPPGAIAQMARTLGGCAVQVAASEAKFTRCRSFLWARLSGSKGTMDVLFDLKNAEAATPAIYPAVTEINARMRDRVFARRAGVSR